MDIDRAYDLYLKKKNEIMKMFEQMETEENNNDNNNENNVENITWC
jgi:hypothetical protein